MQKCITRHHPILSQFVEEPIVGGKGQDIEEHPNHNCSDNWCCHGISCGRVAREVKRNQTSFESETHKQKHVDHISGHLILRSILQLCETEMWAGGWLSKNPGVGCQSIYLTCWPNIQRNWPASFVIMFASSEGSQSKSKGSYPCPAKIACIAESWLVHAFMLQTMRAASFQPMLCE